jgi:hypothetical protein
MQRRPSDALILSVLRDLDRMTHVIIVRGRNRAGHGGSDRASSDAGSIENTPTRSRYFTRGIYRGSSITQSIAFRDRLLYEAEV